MAKKGNAPQRPRRWTPKQGRDVIGRMMVPCILLAMLAISIEQVWLLLIAGVLWVAMLIMLFIYWRCPVCGKSLPKMGKTQECPRCGAKID